MEHQGLLCVLSRIDDRFWSSPAAIKRIFDIYRRISWLVNREAAQMILLQCSFDKVTVSSGALRRAFPSSATISKTRLKVCNRIRCE